MDKFIFYTNPQSRARVAHWMLEECDADYQSVVLEYGTSMKAPAYLAINPMGKVPALKHGDTVITENAAICAYLADAFANKGLAPEFGSPERGSYYRWLFFVAGPLEAAALAKATGAVLDPKQAGYGRMQDVLDTLQGLVEKGPYVVSGRFTAADLMLSAYLAWYMQFGLIEKRAAFEEYVAVHMQRDAKQRADRLGEALLGEAQKAAQ